MIVFQVDPDFAYAHTLLGHEYVLIEELDKALMSFRNATRLDPRHYNAWYGIGLTYYKQERFQLADMYFKKALKVNPHNSVLMCHVAVVRLESIVKTGDNFLKKITSFFRFNIRSRRRRRPSRL